MHLALGAFSVLAVNVLPMLFVGDIGRYATIVDGPRFWAEQPVEFPPVSALYIWLVARWGDESALVMPVVNLAFSASTAVVLARAWGAAAANRYLVLGALLLPISLYRLDHVSVLLAVVGLAATTRALDARAGAWLALATMAKVWPAAIVGALVGRRNRAVLWAAGLLTILTAVWVIGYGPDGPLQVLGFRGAAGWQVESLGGSVLQLLGNEPGFEAGAWRVGAPPRSLLGGLAIVGLGIFAASRRVERIEQRALALVLGLMLLTPLLSPQFLLWLCPLVAVLPAGRLRRLQSLLLGSAILYTLLIALFYGYLLEGDPLTLLTLLIRNTCLVAMLVLALVPDTDAPNDAARTAADSPALATP